MSEEYADLFREWRVADRAAHDLEQQIVRAALDSLTGAGEAPTPEQRDAAHKLRATANDLFELAMAEMKRSADATRH